MRLANSGTPGGGTRGKVRSAGRVGSSPQEQTSPCERQALGHRLALVKSKDTKQASYRHMTCIPEALLVTDACTGTGSKLLPVSQLVFI